MEGRTRVCYFVNEPDKYFYYDVDDWDIIHKYSWHLTEDGYAQNRLGEYAHRLIAGAHITKGVIHLNGNTLDDRLENLKIIRGIEPAGKKQKLKSYEKYIENSNYQYKVHIITKDGLEFVEGFSDLECAIKAIDDRR